MERWKGSWERRGETIVTVAAGSGVAWSAAILASPAANVSVWPPLAVFGFFLIVGAYFWIAPSVEHLPLPGRAAAFAHRSQEHPSFKDHVRDLHQHAEAVRDVINPRAGAEGTRCESLSPIDLDASATREFAAHFGDAAATIDEWNVVAVGDGEAEQELATAIERVIQPLLPNRDRGEMPYQILHRIATGYYPIERSELAPGPDGRLNITFSGEPPAWCIAMPPAAAAEGFDTRIKEALDELPRLPEAAEVRRRSAEFKRIRPLLMEQLREVRRTHLPGGHCDKCP